MELVCVWCREHRIRDLATRFRWVFNSCLDNLCSSCNSGTYNKTMNCIFCKIIAGEIPCHKIYEDENVFSFLDIHPNNLGHALIIPKEHFENLLETPSHVAEALMVAVQLLAPRILSAVDAHGFNVGINTGVASGQMVMHTHVHIIPRFEEDGLVHWPTKEILSEEFNAVAKKIRSL